MAWPTLWLALLLALYPGPAAANTLTALSTTPASSCTCNVQAGVCDSTPVGCAHGYLLKLQAASAWGSTLFQWTTLDAAPSATHPECMDPKNSTSGGNWLVCALYVPSSGMYGLTVDGVSVTLNLTAPEFLLFDQTTNGCNGAPGIDLINCYHGAVLRIQHTGMAAFSGTYAIGAASPSPQMAFIATTGTVSPNAACLNLTITPLYVYCQLAVTVTTPTLTLMLNLQQAATTDPVIPGQSVTGKTIGVYIAKGIPANVGVYPLAANLTVSVRVPYVSSVSGQCTTLGLASSNPNVFLAGQCVHAGTITIYGHGFYNVSFLFRTPQYGFTGPKCSAFQLLGSTALVCSIDLSAGNNNGAEHEIVLNSTISNGFGNTVLSTATSRVRITFIDPVLTTLSGGGQCLSEDVTSLTGCRGLTTIVIGGVGFYSANVSENVMFLTATGGSSSAAPTLQCFAVAFTALSCELQVPPGLTPGLTWQLTGVIKGLAITTALYLISPLTQPTAYPQPLVYASAVTLGDSAVVVVGGQTVGGVDSAAANAYDVETNGNYSALPPMPTAKACASAVGVQDPANVALGNRWAYVVGGSADPDAGACLTAKQGDRSVSQFDGQTQAWSSLPARVPSNTGLQTIQLPNATLLLMKGVMFRVQVLNDLVLSGVKAQVSSTTGTTSTQWSVYYKAGAASTTPSDWTLLAQSNLTFPTTGQQTIPLSAELPLYAHGLHGGEYAFYVVCGLTDCQWNYPADATLTSLANPLVEYLNASATYATDFAISRTDVRFGGSLLAQRAALGCTTWTYPTFTMLPEGSLTRMSQSYPFWVHKDAKVTSVQLTLGITASASAFMSRGELALDLVQANGTVVTLMNDAAGSVSWQAGTAYYRFDDAAPSISGLASLSGSGSLQQPYSMAPTTPLTSLFLSPVVAGQYSVRATDAVGGPTFNITGFDLRVCQEQPGLAAAATAAVDGLLYTVGGLGSGAFTHSDDEAQAVLLGATVDGYVHTAGFTRIDALQLSALVETTYADDLDVYLTAPPPAGQGLVGQWFVDGTHLDATVYGRHGNLPAAVTFPESEGCKVNGFPPAKFASTYVSLPYFSKPQVESRTLWLKLAAGDSATYSLVAWGTSALLDAFSSLYVQAGAVVFTEVQTVSLTCSVQTSVTVTDGQWHHIAMTRDATNTVRLYVDGRPSGARQCLTVLAATAVDSLDIGQTLARSQAASPLTGALYDVRLYGVALTAAQCGALYAQGCGGQVVNVSTTDVGADNTAFGLQTFSASGAVKTSSNFPSTDPTVILQPDNSFAALQSVSGGHWRLRLVNAATGLTGTLRTWTIQVVGTQQFPVAGTATVAANSAATPQFRFGPLGQPRYGHALVAVGPLLYAIGGAADDPSAATPLSSVEVLDTTHTALSYSYPTWTAAASLTVARYMPAVAVVGEVIYVAGGKGPSGLLTTVERYDPSTGQWTLLSSSGPGSRSLVYGRLGAFFTTAYQRLYVGGGLNTLGQAVATVDAVDFQAKEECWRRQADVSLVAGCSCSTASGGCASAGVDYANGFFFFGALGNESACASMCDAEPRCYSYTYASGQCYGVVQLGSQCGPASVTGALSGTRSCGPSSWTVPLVKGWTPSGSSQGAYLDISVPTAGALQLTGLTVQLLRTEAQTLQVFYHPGSYRTAQVPWTANATNFTFAVSPTSAGAYRLTLPTAITLSPGYHAVYLFSDLPRTFGIGAATAATFPVDYGRVAIFSGSQSDTLWTIGNLALPLGAVHFAPPAQHTTRTSCFVPVVVASPGTAVQHFGLPYATAGFAVFARLLTTNPSQRQGLLWKTSGGGVAAAGGFAVSLVNGSLAVQTVAGWQPLGPSLAANVTYNVRLSFDGVGLWTLVVGSQPYTLAAPAAPQAALAEVVVGSEGGQYPWLGAIQNVTVDCSGPDVNATGLVPLVGQWGIVAHSNQTLVLAFQQPVLLIGGSVHVTTSILGGLLDGTVLGTTDLDVSNATVTVSGGSVTLQLPFNFTYGARHQVSVDTGLVRGAVDAGVFDGFVNAPPKQAAWWFAVSNQYQTDSCIGQSCAVCNSCTYQYTRPDGHQVYLCSIPTAQYGRIEAQRLDVSLVPTAECP